MAIESDIITTTTRLELIRFSDAIPSHASFLVKLWNTELFISLEGKTGIDTDEKALGVIRKRFLEEYKRNGYGAYLLRLKSELRHMAPYAEITESWPEGFIGTVSLTRGTSSDCFTAPDVGFATVPELTGKGIATEAARGVIAYAAEELGVKDVFGLCDPDNSASRRVLAKAGLEFRGRMKMTQFGGVVGAVYCTPNMPQDLTAYNVKEEFVSEESAVNA